MRIVVLFSIVALFIVFVISFGYNFSGDVYQDSEAYIVNDSYENMIRYIDKFKEQNPSYKLITARNK